MMKQFVSSLVSHVCGLYSSGRPRKCRPSENSGTKPPTKPGEYRIRDNDNVVKYVGETNNLYRRMKEHVRSGKCATGNTFEYKVADGRSTSRTRRAHEQQKIRQHKPYANKSVGGEGRPAKH